MVFSEDRPAGLCLFAVGATHGGVTGRAGIDRGTFIRKRKIREDGFRGFASERCGNKRHILAESFLLKFRAAVCPVNNDGFRGVGFSTLFKLLPGEVCSSVDVFLEADIRD